MQVAAYILVAFHVFISISALVEKGKRKNWHKEKVVFLPFLLPVFGMLCGSVFCIPTVIGSADGEWYFYFLGAWVLLCDSMIVAYLNCVIHYDGEGFTAKNFFGITYHCSYGEVEGIRCGRDSRIFFRGHSMMIDEMSNGHVEFIWKR